MDRRDKAAIDLVEASYDLELPPGDWLPNLIRAGGPMLDFGMGCYGFVAAGVSKEGVPLFAQAQGSPGAEDLPLQLLSAAQEAGPALVKAPAARLRGQVFLLSDLCKVYPRACEIIKKHVGCQDILSLSGVDPDGRGIFIGIPSPKMIELDRRDREFWHMLEVHLAAGHRLRRGLGESGSVQGALMTEATFDADALIDPTRFLISHANGEARHAQASKRIREAAQAVDKARGGLRRRDPEQALRLWQGLVRGRWSLVDWFDTDRRRFVLAKPNAPRILDPRGLTEREAQVASYAAAGESSKRIGYRLGLSASYVSRLLNDAMRKLDVKTQAQLVEKMRGVLPEASTAA